MFEPFQQFIQEAAKNYGIATELEASKVCQDFRGVMAGIFADKKDAEKYIEPAYFKKNVLVVDVENPGWAQEVIMRKPKIIKEMNEKAGKEIIKNLRTRLRG